MPMRYRFKFMLKYLEIFKFKVQVLIYSNKKSGLETVQQDLTVNLGGLTNFCLLKT